MTGRLAGKTAIVTGANGDLASAVVELFAAEGARLATLDLALPDEGRQPAGTAAFACDVTRSDSVAEVVAGAVEALGSAPDILVNAAGIIGRPAPSHEATEDEFDALFSVNVKGVWLMTKHVVPHMIAAGRGSIVNFSSIHGITGGSTVPLYHATKGAVRLLSKADAMTYGPQGIRVNSIHPGSMNSRMSRSAATRSAVGEAEYYRQLLAGNALPRQGQPDELAQGVLFLASDESSFMTGAELVIDGGYTAH